MVATETEPGAAPLLVDLRAYSLPIIPLRLALGIAGLVGARLLGVAPGASVALFGLGGGLFLFAMLAMSRRRSAFWQRVSEAGAADRDSPVEDWPRTLARATYPSTIGVTALTAIALLVDASLAALTAGLLAGMAVGGAIFGAELVAWERSRHVRLFITPGMRSKLFVREAG